MKKLLSISLISLLLVSTIGITVHKHYCESTLVATSLLPHVEDACEGDMPMDHDTCEDQHDHYSVDSPLALMAIAFDLEPSVEWIDAVEVLQAKLYTEDFLTSKIYADLSPPPTEPNIYTKVQAFLL